MKRTGPTNQILKNLIVDLRKKSTEEGVGIWKRIAKDLERPTRQRRVVNLYKINKYTKDGDFVIVPGKILATGELDHNVIICGFNLSDSAKDKIKSKGSFMTIPELMKKNPKGKDIKIIG